MDLREWLPLNSNSQALLMYCSWSKSAHSWPPNQPVSGTKKVTPLIHAWSSREGSVGDEVYITPNSIILIVSYNTLKQFAVGLRKVQIFKCMC